MEARRWLIEALQAVHALGLVYGDMKPTNVLLAADRPRVIDFGISRVLEGTRRDRDRYARGRPEFMSPEEAQEPASRPPSDVLAWHGDRVRGDRDRAGRGGDPVATVYRVVHAEPDLAMRSSRGRRRSFCPR